MNKSPISHFFVVSLFSSSIPRSTTFSSLGRYVRPEELRLANIEYQPFSSSRRKLRKCTRKFTPVSKQYRQFGRQSCRGFALGVNISGHIRRRGYRPGLPSQIPRDQLCHPTDRHGQVPGAQSALRSEALERVSLKRVLPLVVAVCCGWLWVVQVRPRRVPARPDPDLRHVRTCSDSVWPVRSNWTLLHRIR